VRDKFSLKQPSRQSIQEVEQIQQEASVKLNNVWVPYEMVGDFATEENAFAALMEVRDLAKTVRLEIPCPESVEAIGCLDYFYLLEIAYFYLRRGHYTRVCDKLGDYLYQYSLAHRRYHNALVKFLEMVALIHQEGASPNRLQ